MARRKAHVDFLLTAIELLFYLLPTQNMSKLTAFWRGWVSSSQNFRGRGRPSGIFLVSGKTRHILLSDSANCTVLCAVVLTQYWHETDGRTDRQSDGRNCYSWYSACNPSIVASCKNKTGIINSTWWYIALWITQNHKLTCIVCPILPQNIRGSHNFWQALFCICILIRNICTFAPQICCQLRQLQLHRAHQTITKIAACSLPSSWAKLVMLRSIGLVNWCLP